jgi:hypothetical protein
MAGFSDGFAQGFGLVDAAMQRRTTNDIAQQELAQKTEANRIAEEKNNREFGLKDVENRLKEAENQSQDKYRQGMIEYYKSQANTNRDELNKDYEIQKGALRVNEQNAKTNQIQAQAAANESAAATKLKNWQLQSQQNAEAKQAALSRFRAFVHTDPDGTAMVRLPGGEAGIKALEDFKTFSEVDPIAVASSYPEYKQAFQTMQQAALNPAAFAKDQRSALQALNTLWSIGINKGVGPYDGEDPRYIGSTIDRKEASSILYHPPEQGYPEGFYTLEVTSYGKDKDGKPIKSTGPMTEFRSSSLHDQNVRRITPQQFAQQMFGYEAIINLLDANPQFRADLPRIAGIGVKGKDSKGKIIRTKVPAYEGEGESRTKTGDKEVLYDSTTGRVIDPEEQIKRQSDDAELEKWQSSAPRLTESPQEKQDLSPALINVNRNRQ